MAKKAKIWVDWFLYIQLEYIYKLLLAPSINIFQKLGPDIYILFLTVFNNSRYESENYFYSFFVYWHIKRHRLFNAKAILVEEQQRYYLTHIWR